jgi:hypothetical protein
MSEQDLAAFLRRLCRLITTKPAQKPPTSSFAPLRLALALAALVFSSSAAAIPFDTDGDLVEDFVDNCLMAANPGQGDGDHDGRGTACDADLTQDLFVGGPDFTAYVLCFGQAPVGACAAADLNEDGAVDALDFPQLLAGFNQPPGPSAGAQVHGHVSLRNSGSTAGRSADFRLPRITVYLEDVLTGRASRRAVTNPHGYFQIPKETIGEYRVCFEGTDFISSCDPLPAVLTYETHVRRDDYTIEPVGGAIIGEVLQRDPLTLETTSCFRESSYFQTLDQSTVTLLDQGGTAIRSGAANSQGEYLVPGLPTPGTYRLRATCGPRTNERVIQIQADGTTQLEDFSFVNSQPRIRSLEASLGTSPVQVAAPGDVLQLTAVAVDAEGGPLHYKWRSETPGFVSQDSPSLSWTLPAFPARNTLYLEVSDEAGGFATRIFRVSTGASDVLFQGIVIDRDSGLPIGGAKVTVGGKVVVTPASGGFSILAPRANRYVLNSEKHGYTFVSQVFHASTVGLNIRMGSQPIVPVDPTVETILVASSERNTLQGALRIPANCLVQRDGTPPTGNLSASFYTYDPTVPDAIPGDFSAIDVNQKDVRLESFGAFGVDVWDPNSGSDVPYTLAQNCEATFDVDTPASMRGYAPASIPLLEYDPVRGYWDEAAPPATFNGVAWTGAVPGFSSWNMDLAFSDSACIKLEVPEQTNSKINYPFVLRVSIPTGTPPGSGVDKVKEFPVTESPNGLFRLPPNQDIKLEILGDAALGNVYKTILANSGPVVAEAFPPWPYSDCQGLDTATGESPVLLELEVPTHKEQWLSRQGGIYTIGTKELISEEQQILETEAYYDVIDPGSLKDTLTKWKAENGFPNEDTIFSSEVRAVYYNNLDLKLGRQMHCLKTANGPDIGDVACWVTNFGAPGGPPVDGLGPAIGNLNGLDFDPGATVTMEYDASLGSSEAENEVSFYVFGPDGNRIPRVALDIEGAKPVPQICLICHGGEYEDSTHSVTGAAFREFDVFGFEFDEENAFGLKFTDLSGIPQPFTGQDFSLNGQREAFRELNAMVKSTNPRVDGSGFSPIVELIDGLYPGGVDVPNAVATDTYVPVPWSSADDPTTANVVESLDKSALYNTITKRHCRACHIAQGSYYDFYEYSDFQSLENVICSDREMPHAQAPFNNFWLNTVPPAEPNEPMPAVYLGTELGFTGLCPTVP